ncbi:hypothetical protein EX30DRAFT_86488 [Ascodesmis nigricans]|uniref:N-acetyltransferase domain-containing protein n=1 Tax=Ascodesmis nigricans TaxID=341454 RepID=A0A4S2N3F1_9PEZI|nr:hypothetical protein EX30DRAFT_86488 [Ascodesmis nigricans]
MSSEPPSPQLIHPASAHQLLPAYQLLTNALAQRRQTFNSQVILHPTTLAAYALLASFFLRFNLSIPLPTRILLLTGVTIALLSALRHYSEPFLEAAEKMATQEGFERRILRKNGKEMDPKDVIMVLEWEHRVVGVCCVFGPEAEVWGWSVERRYCGRGLGKDLLVEAVKEWKKRNPGKEAGELKVTQDCPCKFPFGLGRSDAWMGIK